MNAKVVGCKNSTAVRTVSILSGSETENQFIFQEKGTVIGDISDMVILGLGRENLGRQLALV